MLHGATRPNKPIMGSAPSRVDIDWGGTKTPGGVELWQVGTDVAKDWLSTRMQLAEGAGAMHFHEDLPPEWFDQMVVEQPRTRWAKGRAIRDWVKPNGARNEAWDVSVYNLAIAYQLGLHKWSALDWARLRTKLIPPMADLFAPVPEQAPQALQAPSDAEPPAAAIAVQTSVRSPDPQQPDPPVATPAMLIPPKPQQPQPRTVGRRVFSRGISR